MFQFWDTFTKDPNTKRGPSQKPALASWLSLPAASSCRACFGVSRDMLCMCVCAPVPFDISLTLRALGALSPLRTAQTRSQVTVASIQFCVLAFLIYLLRNCELFCSLFFTNSTWTKLCTWKFDDRCNRQNSCCPLDWKEVESFWWKFSLRPGSIQWLWEGLSTGLSVTIQTTRLFCLCLNGKSSPARLANWFL